MGSSLVLYFPGKTFFHRLDPRAKLAFLLLISTIIFAQQSMLLSSIILATMILLWSLAKLPISVVVSFLKALFPLFIFLFIVQAIFYPGTTPLVKPLIPRFIPLIGGTGAITLEGMLFAVLLALRLLAMVILLPLVSMTTPVNMLALGMVRLGMPYPFAYAITTALNMVPILQTETGTIVDAQRLRAMQVFEKGHFYDKLKAYPALVTPLVIGSMRKAQSMAVAMDSRAFGASKNRTYIQDIKITSVDWAFMIATLLYSVAILVAAFLNK